MTAPLKGETPLWRQIPSSFYVRTPEGLRVSRYPNVYRYMHLDLADTGQAGISIVHKERSIGDKVLYVADLILRVNSPNRISFEALFQFVIDLVQVFHIKFSKITADQYQSTAFLQMCETRHLADNVEKLSVDRDAADAYATWSNIIADDAFKCGPCDYMKEEMSNIFFDKNKPYVSVGRKDVSDSVCGSVFNAAKNPLDYPAVIFEYANREWNSDKISIPKGFIRA